jgi:hypothetical protein
LLTRERAAQQGNSNDTAGGLLQQVAQMLGVQQHSRARGQDNTAANLITYLNNQSGQNTNGGPQCGAENGLSIADGQSDPTAAIRRFQPLQHQPVFSRMQTMQSQLGCDSANTVGARQFQPRNRLALVDKEYAAFHGSDLPTMQGSEAVESNGGRAVGAATETCEFPESEALPKLKPPPVRVSSEELDAVAFQSLKARNTRHADSKKAANAAAAAAKAAAKLAAGHATMKRPAHAAALAAPPPKRPAVVLNSKQKSVAESACTWKASRDAGRAKGSFTTACFRGAESAGKKHGFPDDVVYEMRKHGYAFGVALWDKKNKT